MPQRIDRERLLTLLQQGLGPAPAGIDSRVFQQLCVNIVDAIVEAFAQHQRQSHQPEPEFGEAEREV
jgi:hypothetical protein